MIPRIIHQIWLQGGLPPELAANVDRLKALNPGWEHRLYGAADAERILASFDRTTGEAYRKINPRYRAAQADFLRHLIIYRHGGVYCDIKSGFSKPLNDVLLPTDTYVLVRVPSLHKELPNGEYLTHFIIAKPAHPFTAQVIHRLTYNVLDYKPWAATGRNGVLRTTGPIAYTLAIDSRMPSDNYRIATEDELGAYYSFGDWTAPDHYSELRAPVVRMRALGSTISRFFTGLRSAKALMTG